MLCIWLIAFNVAFIWGNSLLPGEISQAFSDWVKALLSFLLSGESTGSGAGSGILPDRFFAKKQAFSTDAKRPGGVTVRLTVIVPGTFPVHFLKTIGRAACRMVLRSNI